MKKYLVFVLAVVLIGALATGALARGKTGPAGKSNVGHLYLVEKDPVSWEIVEGGAWGKMKYNLSGSTFDFVFNGHGLEAGVDYCLIYYPDPWPGTDLICLGSATANGGGNVHIAGSNDTGDLPALTDWNHPDNPNSSDSTIEGAKIWLVLCDDVNSGMTGWNPGEYLFETEGIFFDDTDV